MVVQVREDAGPVAGLLLSLLDIVPELLVDRLHLLVRGTLFGKFLHDAPRDGRGPLYLVRVCSEVGPQVRGVAVRLRGARKAEDRVREALLLANLFPQPMVHDLSRDLQRAALLDRRPVRRAPANDDFRTRGDGLDLDGSGLWLLLGRDLAERVQTRIHSRAPGQ